MARTRTAFLLASSLFVSQALFAQLSPGKDVGGTWVGWGTFTNQWSSETCHYSGEPTLLIVAFVGWCCYRGVMNRPRKLIRRFASRIKKMPEVRLIVERDRQVTVAVDHVVARILVRVNAQIDKANDKWFRGEKFTVKVRDDVAGEELRGLLQGTGVLYVRKDLLEERV